jgi:predicted secreted acid phosphatase
VGGLSTVEELIDALEKSGCINIADYVRERKVNWVEIRSDVRKQLKARGYDVKFEGSRMCISKRKDVVVDIAEFIIQKKCVHRRQILNQYNMTGEEWKKIRGKIVKMLGAKGYKMYKYGGWVYCIGGARPEQTIEITIPLFVKIDVETAVKLEELAKKRGVSKAEVVREIIAGYLEKQALVPP